jgi:two-component system chemotaxis response regulator CheB
MITHDIIVIGASAGGVEALRQLVASIPKDFRGSLFVVLHIPPYMDSQLPKILSAAGSLKAVHPKNGEKIKPGMIYVAPSDHHLLLERDRVVVSKGPKENRFRPSIDALFRSAAVAYGPRVIGIILSGILNDGTSGLWSIKRQGGKAIIQSVEDAEYSEMARNVLEYVKVDFSVPATEMGGLLQKLITQQVKKPFGISKKEIKRLETEVIIAMHDNAFQMGIIEMGELTPFTCPECHGALVRLVEGEIVRFRCHTGHAYTASSLLTSITESVEEILWQGMRGMEEATILLNNIADHFERRKNHAGASIFRKKANDTARRARTIHESVFQQEQYSEDMRYKGKRVVKKEKT